MEQLYEAFYARFDTPSKKVGALMMGADDLVGNAYTVSMKVEDGVMVAWIANKFGAERGFFDRETSERIQLALAKGWEVRALLSFVAYSDVPEPGVYWGEMAVFCFSPSIQDKASAFIDRIATRLGEGVRPKINLGQSSVQKMLSNPDFMPKDTVALPKKEIGTAIIKDHLSMSDKMVEQGRARNKGCYVVSWIFIIAVAALVIYIALRVMGVIA